MCWAPAGTRPSATQDLISGGGYGEAAEEGAPRKYIPFSGGPHSCIGQALGKLHYHTTVPMLLSHFSFRLAEEARGPARLICGWLTML